MRCCVSFCNNDSRFLSKSSGISFHSFPTKPTHRKAWLVALGKERWSPRQSSAVCSAHFSPGDMYEAEGGVYKVRPGAVPVVQLNSINLPDGSQNDLKVCRICLDTDTKFLDMSQYKLHEAFHHLTGILVYEDSLPQQLCPECAHRLLNCDSFRRKSLRAHDLMLDIVNKQTSLTIDSLKTISRSTNNLTSPLKIEHIEVDKYDLQLEFIEKTEEELKNENVEILFTAVKDEFEDVDATHFDNYSTDDSLPLEVQRQKKKKKQAKRVKKKPEPAEPKVDRRRRPLLNSDLSETLFTITDLTYEEQVAEIEKRRETSNYKNAVYKCEECYKGFLDEDAYGAHMMRHTDECGAHACGVCKTRFGQRHALRKHVTAHHTQRYSCTACAYVTTHRQTARLHERWHRGTRYRCPHCPDEFVKFTTYMGHVRIKHPSDFVCALCGYSFVSQKGLDMHRKLKHRTPTDTPPAPADGPRCERCDVRFASLDAYRRHLSVSARHADDPEAAKSKRSRRSKDAAPEAGAEAAVEGGEGEAQDCSGAWRRAGGAIPCEQCGLQLEDSRAYHGHFRRAHPDKNRTKYPAMRTPCMCEVCGRMFQSAALLRDHRWTHTGERPFACDACGKRFRMRQRLVAHRRVHAPRRHHACGLCGKTFSTASNRQRHMFIHTGLKPYKCEMCGKCFKHASEKRAHVTYVHLKKPWPKRARAKRPRAGDAGASETEILWDKLDMPPAPPPAPDKPMYYNLKI